MAKISELIESAELIEAVAVLDAAQAILEATGEYYYEDITLKRWILGDGGRAGNCEICVDNADRGWIDMDDVWDSIDGSIDEPPAHPNCTCEQEVKDTRRRVYV